MSAAFTYSDYADLQRQMVRQFEEFDRACQLLAAAYERSAAEIGELVRRHYSTSRGTLRESIGAAAAGLAAARQFRETSHGGPVPPEPWRVVRPETIRRCGVLTGVHR